MTSIMKKIFFAAIILGTCNTALAHYPILDCQYMKTKNSAIENVICEASFSDRSKAPNIVMEIVSEDDEILAKGRTNSVAKYQFSRPEGIFFIIMDAGPGHVLEISDEEVNES
jgi:hypothetical protein